MKTLGEKIAVMQAALRGEPIQCTYSIASTENGGEAQWWDGIVEPKWDWRNYDYRVKPKEPREFWIMYRDNRPASETFGYPNEIEVMTTRNKTGESGWIKVREVIES